MSNKPKIKYAKERNGNIFYPRTVADAIRFNDGESLEQKSQNGGLGGGDVKNFPVATELEAREATSNEVLMTPLRTLQLLEENGGGVGGGGGGITIPIISSEYNKTSVDTGTEISIPFTFYSPNLGKGVLHGLVDGVETINMQVPQGSSYADFGVLPKGSHRLSIFVVDRGGVYTDTLSFNIRIGALDISSTFDDSTDFTITQVIKIPVTIDTISVDPVYLTYTIDSTSTRISAKTGYNIIQLPVLSPGAHKVTIKAESGVYVSNILSFNVVIEDATNLTLISDFDIKEITYRKLVEFIYRVSLKGVSQFTAQYYDNDTLIKTLTIPAGTNIWSTRELEVGEHTLKIVVTTEDGSKTAELVREFTVIESDYKPLEPVSDASLIAWFDATGKTNNDFDKEVWEDKSPALEHPTVDFYNVNYGTNGWIDNALKLNGGAYAVINLQPLTEVTNAGLTLDIKYRTRDVGNQEACVLDLRGSDVNGKGFAIDTQKMYMNSASTRISSDVIQEETSRATFVIDKFNGIAKIYNNAVLTETFLMSSTEDFFNSQNIYLGTKLEMIDGKFVPNIFGDCEIYSIRVYARALESDEIVRNHISDIVDLIEQQEKYELNYMNNMPTMYFYGDTSAMTKDFKVPLRIKYISTNPDLYGDSFDLADCLVSWQGTSSLQYAVKNYKIRLKNQDGTKYKYSPYPDGIKEDTFCLKADYMESSHANNTGMAKFINDQLYDTPTPPQALDPNVRTTINGFPIQLYIALNDSVEPTYIGIFNFNHDKSCNKSLGLNNEVEGFEECVRFEVKANSDTSAGAFRDDSDESLRNDFEINYPDEDDLTSEQIDAHYAKLKRVVSWVKNCTAETFKAELEQYFNKEYLIRYFVQAHLFGMVDNLGKNMMIATWDGLVWYLMFYDMDTQLGLDNTGYMEFASDVDVVEGVYNTSNSKLFVMLQECFPEEIAETYCKLRRTGKYSMPSILSYWYGEQVSKIGELQYNKDMEAKYIAFKNDYLFMLHGRRYEHMKKWITERMLYLDTIYGFEADTSASITIRANTLNTITLDITTYSPQYLKVKWRNGVEQVLRIGRDEKGNMIPSRFSGTVATATDQEIIIYNAQQIKNIEGFASANPSVLNLVEASRLLAVECRDAKVLDDVRISSNNKFLGIIDLNGCSTLGSATGGGGTTLDLSSLNNLTYLDVGGTQLESVPLPTGGCSLNTAIFSPNTKSIVLENMPALKEVEFNSANHLTTFRIVNCPRIPLKDLVVKSSDVINNTTVKNNMVQINAENIYIKKSFINDLENGRIFINGGSLRDTIGNSVNLTTFHMEDLDLTDVIMQVNCINAITTEPTISSFNMKNIKALNSLYLTKVGFLKPSTLDLSTVNVENLKIADFANLETLKLPSSDIKGLTVVKPTQISSMNYCIWMHNVWGTGVNNNNALPLEDEVGHPTLVLNDEELIGDTLDLSSFSITNFLGLKGFSNFTKFIINCDFTKGDNEDMRQPNVVNYLYEQVFSLPTTSVVEGYLKSTNAGKIWCKATATEYPLMETLDNIEWDLSEVTELNSLFENWKALTKVPDCITPELLENSSAIRGMFKNCTSLSDLNKLEGADLVLPVTVYHQGPGDMFLNVKGPFTLGNVTILTKFYAPNFNAILNNMFGNSGLTSIGDFTFSNEVDGEHQKGDLGGIFDQCKSLKHIGNVNVSYSTSYSNFFNECISLESIGNISLTNESCNVYTGLFKNTPITDEVLSKLFIPEGANLASCFWGTKITDLTKLNNYYNIIKTATNLDSTFRASSLLSVPDLDIVNSTTLNNMFDSCLKLKTVGSLTYYGTGTANSMFTQCSALETIDKIDFPNTPSAQSMFVLGGDKLGGSLKRIDYLDLSSYELTSGWMALFYAYCTFTEPKHIGFEGKVTKTIAEGLNTTNSIKLLLDLESWQKFVECAETLSSPYTYSIQATNFALFTEEMLATMSAKNWTITA